MVDNPTTHWQPIKSAPKDGTVVLLHVDWEPLTVVGFWGTGMPSSAKDDNSPQWRVKWDHSRIAEGYDEPTHWAPLPEDVNGNR